MNVQIETNKPTINDLENEFADTIELANKVVQADIDRPKLRQFDKSIYNALPPILKDGCGILTDDTEKEVFLIGALAVISGLLPNVEGLYDANIVGPNLYAYMVAPFGAGKGSLSHCRKLGASIHKSKGERYEGDKAQYEVESETNKNLTPPTRQMLFIPANNSKTGFFQLLDDNGGRGIMFETEGDTLADAVKQDYGNYSDGLRKAFHHEPISYFRRKDSELVEIESPELSVVLTSTFGQLVKLMPSAENGLYSRFMYYRLKSNPDFKDVFNVKKKEYHNFFNDLGLELKLLYFNLDTLNTPISFSLTEKQQQNFLVKFKQWKKETIKGKEVLAGMVNRLGLICFRIAMIFTVLRIWDADRPTFRTSDIVCTDLDYDNALQIIEVLMGHSISIYLDLPITYTKKSNYEEKNEKVQKVLELKVKGLSIRDIAKQTGMPKSTVGDWVKKKRK